jgi:hypothetical protein
MDAAPGGAEVAVLPVGMGRVSADIDIHSTLRSKVEQSEAAQITRE